MLLIEANALGREKVFLMQMQEKTSSSKNPKYRMEEPTHACKSHERVRAATAAATIRAARILTSPMLSASPAMNSWALSPSSSTSPDRLAKLKNIEQCELYI